MTAPSKPRKPRIKVSMPALPRAVRDPDLRGARPPRKITSEPFKEDARAGTYAIDAFAGSVPWRAGLEPDDARQAVGMLRGLVAQCGYEARQLAAGDDADADRRIDAVAHLKALGEIEDACRRVQGRDVEAFQHHFAITPAADGLDADAEVEAAQDAFAEAGADLDDVARLAGELAVAIAALRDRRPIGTASNSTSGSPLIDRFIQRMSISWEAVTGEKVPTTVAYARLLAAAWKGLGFPGLGDDPVEKLGRRHNTLAKPQTQAEK